MNTCLVCGKPVVGRADKKHCSPECKRESKRAYDTAYHRANAEKKITASKTWYERNTERKRQYDAEYRSKTNDYRLELKREQSKIAYRRDITKSREKSRLAVAKRYARSRSGGYSVKATDIERQRVRQNDCCYYCNSALSGRGELDHVVPITRGGVHSIGNIVIACRACNRSKAHRLVVEWRLARVVARKQVL